MYQNEIIKTETYEVNAKASTEEVDSSNKQIVSVYQELTNILNSVKNDELSISEAMNKISLKTNQKKYTKPYCKYTKNGLVALYGISQKPIVLQKDEWITLLKLCKTNYIENYLKYNNFTLNIV